MIREYVLYIQCCVCKYVMVDDMIVGLVRNLKFRRLWLFFLVLLCMGNLNAAAPEVVAVVEGAIQDVSRLPDQKNLAYPDCNYTISVDLKQIISGSPVPQKIIVIVPGYRQYKATPFVQMKLESGMQIRLKLVNFELLPEQEKSIQLVDDLNDFDRSYWTFTDIIKINTAHLIRITGLIGT